MRTIKFRGKDYETGEWVYGHFFQRLGHYPAIVEPRPRDGKVMYYEIAVEDTTVGQFTGLMDKNGKEIYEGDMIVWGENDYKSPPLVVLFKHGAFGYTYIRDCFHSFAGNTNFTFNPLNTDVRFEIIGNIHDNPELLKGGEK